MIAMWRLPRHLERERTDPMNDAGGNNGDNRTGKFLGIPYDWRPPTWERFKMRWWNPNDDHIITPKSFGWGYDFNLNALLRRLHLIR